MANILQMLSKESIVEMKKKNTRVEFCDSDFSSFTHFCKYFKNKNKNLKTFKEKKKALLQWKKKQLFRLN